jgi:hypothetical protein
VVGSGIAGISTAYELSQRGLSVIVIDRKRICGGMTARTSAHLVRDDLLSESTNWGSEAARLFYESQAAAVERIEEIQKSQGIECDFRRLDGYSFRKSVDLLPCKVKKARNRGRAIANRSFDLATYDAKGWPFRAISRQAETFSRGVGNSFDLVPVGVSHERAVVICIVLGTDTGASFVGAAVLEGPFVKSSDGFPVRGLKGNMYAITWASRLPVEGRFQTEDDIRSTIVKGFVGKLEQPKADQRHQWVVKGSCPRNIRGTE